MHPLDLDFETWDPWTPSEVANLLRGVTAPWYVLAGWALDLFLGRQIREHEDIEIGVPHDRFPEIRSRLEDLALELVVVGDGRGWPLSDESLSAHRQTWVREPNGPWRLDVVREQWAEDDWVYLRDARIRRPGELAIARTSEGIPFMRPEVVLLFKAKASRAKDQLDFETVVPELEREARTWLADALRIAHPGHPWIERSLSH